MGGQAARRLGIPNPEWRPFQLAFLLMNLKGIVEPVADDRKDDNNRVGGNKSDE